MPIPSKTVGMPIPSKTAGPLTNPTFNLLYTYSKSNLVSKSVAPQCPNKPDFHLFSEPAIAKMPWHLGYQTSPPQQIAHVNYDC